MTLCVSLRVPDGIVAAVDSLATVMETLQMQAELRGECPECGKGIELHDIGIPNVMRPASISDTALKMYGLLGQFAVTHFGQQFLHGKTVYRQLRDFERANRVAGFATADHLAKALLQFLDAEFLAEGHDLAAMPDRVVTLGLQVSGYDADDELTGHTYVVRIGKPSEITHYEDFGCTISGDRAVVNKLWKEEEGESVQRPAYNTLSLQDAIDYADFLIRTTADYQRFALMVPTVGGAVDIALVTQYRGFQWIRRKELVTLLEERKGVSHNADEFGGR